MNAMKKQYVRRWTVALLMLLTVVSSAMMRSAAACEPAATPANVRELSFQQGVDGYQGTVDTEIWALAPKTLLNENPNASSDANNDGGESQVLMRFDDIIGGSERQIPKGSLIPSAKLVVSAFDQGSTVNLHRMLVPFDNAATWDSLISGVSADDFEASRHKDGFTFGKIAASFSAAMVASLGFRAWWSGLMWPAVSVCSSWLMRTMRFYPSICRPMVPWSHSVAPRKWFVFIVCPVAK